jgi:ubiquinone/menaquinone biosynthesis C-methylase UbiE
MDPAENGISPEQAKRFYDRYGRRQDGHRHEDAARSELQNAGHFESACNVFELGCGTGSFAKKLFEESLPTTARYTGVDVSSTMIEIAREELGALGPRVKLVETEGAMKFDEPDKFYDRFVATYVLDLLPEEQIYRALVEAHRLLAGHGKLCVVALTHGASFFQRAISGAWSRVHRISPARVGGCRPIDVAYFLHQTLWTVEENRAISAFGVPSQLVIAEPR